MSTYIGSNLELLDEGGFGSFLVSSEQVLVEHQLDFVFGGLGALLLNVLIDLAEVAEDLEGGALGAAAVLGAISRAGIGGVLGLCKF